MKDIQRLEAILDVARTLFIAAQKAGRNDTSISVDVAFAALLQYEHISHKIWFETGDPAFYSSLIANNVSRDLWHTAAHEQG